MEILFDNIDAYIWNLLSDEERQAFEKNLTTDETLRAELALRQLENEAVQLADKADLRTKMKAWREEETAGKKTVTAETKVVPLNIGRIVRFSPMRWAAAAAIALLVFVGARYWATTQYGSDALSTQFYDKMPTGEPFFGASGDAKIDAAALLIEAKTAFKAKDYDKAIGIYQTILSDKTVAANLKQEAEWKQVVTLMGAEKTDKTSDFTSLLSKLVGDTSHPYHQAAVELNQKVNSVWWKMAN